jgi:SAM-dependent methyltransferase
VLDLGCGPGRLVEALAEAGAPALGVDASRHAVQLTGRRGAAVLHRSLFDQLPGEGRWSSVLLFDGNIGIGGSPTALLIRAGKLLAPHGQIIVETEPPGAITIIGKARLEADAWISDWFPWAWVGHQDLAELALAAGLRRVAHHVVEDRWFTTLARQGRHHDT